MANLNLAIPGVMFIWGIAVAAMTWLRSRATPDVAGVLVASWQMITIAATLLRRSIVATDGLDMFDYVAMAPSMLFNVMMAAAFWGYMREGRRPNLFYRRRVRL